MCASFHTKYKILEKIGEGSFSDVLKCQDRQTGMLYAAKRLKKMYQNVDEILDSPEVMATRKVAYHPNVLCMVECHYDLLPGRVTLIFELMDMSLYDLMKNQKGRLMIESRVRNYIFQLLRGLEHLHKFGIFHRDIKPENILLKGGTVKIGDLGSIREIYSRPPYTEYISTRWYRSPECLLTGGFYGPKMDVWAAGCVFYELIALEPLFPGDNEVDQIAKIHGILGTPHARLIAKIRRTSGNRSRHSQVYFPSREGRGLNRILPGLSASGLELLGLMLIYDPENRPAVRRLLEHRYFNDLQRQSAANLINKPKRGTSSCLNNSTTTTTTSSCRQNNSVRRQSELLLACLAAQRVPVPPARVACSANRREFGVSNVDVVKAAAARLVASTPHATCTPRRSSAQIVGTGDCGRIDECEQIGRYFLRKRQSLQANRPSGQSRRWQESAGKWQSQRCCERTREQFTGGMTTPAGGISQDARLSFFLHEPSSGRKDDKRQVSKSSQLPTIHSKTSCNNICAWNTVVYNLGDMDYSRASLANLQKRTAEVLPTRKMSSGKSPLKKMARRELGADYNFRSASLKPSKVILKKSGDQ